MNVSHDVMSAKYMELAWKFHVSSNSCENTEHYEQYIRLIAISDRNLGMGVTHILVDEDTDMIMGYVSLRSTSLVSMNERGNKTVHPAIEIAELAVSEEYERRGIGSTLVQLAIVFADELRRNVVAVKYIVLCADPKAVPFYEKLKFAKVRDVFEVLRDGANDNCEPMFIELPDL